LQPLRACDGERHPGPPDDDDLRGTSPERGSWPVVDSRLWASSPSDGRAGDSGCPLVAKEGNDVGIRPQCVCTRRKGFEPLTFERRRPSLGPETRARRSSLHSKAQVFGGGAFDSVSRSGKPAQAGGTGTGTGADGRCAARRGSPLSQEGSVAHRRKGRRSRPSSLRGSRARVWLLVRRNAVAEVSRRRLVSNTLGTRAPKRAVRVE